MNQDKISLVTMFFDIGRGAWSEQNGIADFANRNNDKYFSYFSYLAALENDLVVFTTEEFVERIQQLRQDRPTKFVLVDLEDQYGEYIEKIANIQADPNFYQKLPDYLRQHPEYRSAPYVLINNLKTHFVNQAIQQGLTQHDQVAWIDFGYCRDNQTLAGIKEWSYSFDPNYIHFFTIKRPTYLGFVKNPHFMYTMDDVYHAIYTNKVYIIGSVFVGTSKKWAEFAKLLLDCQNQLLQENIIDDDQGLYVMAYVKKPSLFKLHFLGKGLISKKFEWFGTIKMFHN